MNKKIIRDFGYEIFEEEYYLYKSDISPTLKKLVSTPYLLVPYNLEDSLNDFPLILKKQNTDSEIFRSLLIQFMMIFDIRVGIYRDSNYIKDKFPLKLGEEDLVLSKKYKVKGKFLLFYSICILACFFLLFCNQYFLIIYY